MVTRAPKQQITIFVEGGGDSKALKAACRHGFSVLLERAGLAGKMPAVVACGGRDAAFKRFAAALAGADSDALHLLLVDAEAPVTQPSPWGHLQSRGDPWLQPTKATDDHCHLMAQCMETWLAADAKAFATFFGNGFKANLMPSRVGAALELEPKHDLYGKIAAATADCKTKAKYGKGAHSFQLLALVDPAEIQKLPWAKRFFDHLLKVA